MIDQLTQVFVIAVNIALLPVVGFTILLMRIFGLLVIPIALLGQLVVPLVYIISLIANGKFKEIIRFIAVLVISLVSNYGIGYLHQILKPVPKMRRGIDATMLYVSMSGFLIVIALIVIALVVISVRATRKKDREDRERERLRIVLDRHAMNRGNH